MGWFGYGVMDGDDPMDFRDELLGRFDVDYDKYWEDEEYFKSVGKLFEERQDEIYDWLKNYDWESRSNPGHIQCVYVQACAYVLMSHNVIINKRGYKGMKKFIKIDFWSNDDKERRKEMKKFKKKFKEYYESHNSK